MLQTLDSTDFDKFYRLMDISFPVDEHRPYEEQKALFSNPAYQVYIVPDAENDEIKAFAAIWNFSTFTFIEHFAVNPSCRNLGLGSQILQELQGLLPSRLCLEVELPDNELAARRIGFYERNGFYYNDYLYLQPALSAGQNTIPLRIMTSPKAVRYEEFLKIKETLYTQVYKQP